MVVAEQAGRIIALASYVPLRDPAWAEMAIVVDDAVQGKGVGTAVLERLGRDAWHAGDALIPYTARFENDPVKATLPAQTVVVTDQLPATIDWNSFEFTSVGFGRYNLLVAPGKSTFSLDVDMRADGTFLLVRITGTLNPQTGLVTVKFASLDPLTFLDPADQLAGFLPPNTPSRDGEGYVGFRVQPLAGLPIGTLVKNSASIVFDENAAIITNEWVNRIGPEHLVFIGTAVKLTGLE